MKISDIRIRKILNDGKMKAVVSVTFDDTFVVHDIKIIQGHNGYFIAMPSRRMPNGEYRDIAHPINSEARNHLQQCVLDYYLSHDPHEPILDPHEPNRDPHENMEKDYLYYAAGELDGNPMQD